MSGQTLAYFIYFEKISLGLYGRPVKHNRLCHGNRLNARYLPQLLSLLPKKGYTFISVDEAMKDKVHVQKDNYNKKLGVSWLCRWMTDKGRMMH